MIFLRSFSKPGVETRGLLTHPRLRAIGRLSYSLYLWQQVFLVTAVPSWGWFRRFPVNLVLLTLVATGSYIFIERPFLRLKESPLLRSWLARKRDAKPLA